jgi:hypothetical protein
LRKFNHLTEVFILAAAALLGIPDTAHGQSLTFSPNPDSLSIAGPGGTTTSTVAVSSTAGINGSLQVATISTSDHTNWLCVQASGQSLTLSIGTNGCTTSQLANNQTYTGTVNVTAPTSSGTQSGTLNVTLQVGSSNASLVASPNPVSFSIQTGGTAPSQNVTITFNGSAATVQSVNTNQNWLLAQSTGSGNVLVSLNASGLSAGNYNGTLTVGTSGGTLNIPVNLSIGGIPALTVNPMTLNFAYQTGTSAPLPQQIALTSNGTPVSVNVTASTSSGGTQWLIVSPTGQLTTPTQLTVSIQPAGLAAGSTYTGNIQISSSSGTVNIPVSLLVSNNPIIAANPASLTFTAQAGSTAPSQTLALTSSGAPLAYTLSSSVTSPAGGNWLQVPTQSGTTGGSITVGVNTSGLAVGTYTGVINVSAPTAGNPTLAVPVTLNIAAGPVLQFSVHSLSFAYQVGQSQPLSQTVTIGSTSGTVGYTVAVQTGNMQPWLNVSATSGTAPGSLVVSVNTTGLAPGTYTGTISLTPTGANSNPQTVQVTLVVSNTALLVLSPSAATFTATAGSGASSFQNLAVTSTDGSPIAFSVVSSTAIGSNWLLVSSTSGTTPTNLSITANPAGLAVGTYTGTVTITATTPANVANSPQTFPVTLNVVSSNTLNVSATSLSFTQAVNGTPPTAQNLSVTSSGATSGGGQITFSATTSLNQGQNWLTVNPSNATTPANLAVTANGAGLAPGTYTGQIILSSPGVNQQTVNVTLTVGSGGGGSFSNSGSMAQIASGGLAATGNWTTTFTLVNNGATAAAIHMNFFSDSGTPLPLALTFPQTSSNPGAPQATFDSTLNPGAVLIIQTTGPTTQAVQTGWAQLLYNGNVGGYAVFGQSTSGASTQEAVVPLETRTPASFVIPYDTTGGYATGVALANVSTVAANITLLIRDDSGNLLQTTAIPLSAQGHTSFVLVTQFGITAQRRGTLEFQTPAGGQISVLGLRFPPGPAFSTVPALTK